MLLATLFFGAVAGIFTSTLNNYLADVHGFDAGSRGWLELPREMPGFLIFGVMGLLLAHLRERLSARHHAVIAVAEGAGRELIGTLTQGDARVPFRAERTDAAIPPIGGSEPVRPAGD